MNKIDKINFEAIKNFQNREKQICYTQESSGITITSHKKTLTAKKTPNNITLQLIVVK